MSHNKNVLENLFGPKARVLKLFLHRPQLVLGLEDIFKKSGLKKRGGRAAVTELRKFGLLKIASNHHDRKAQNKKKKNKK